VAGKGNGFADERHLWPAFHWLIEQRRPLVVFGEQVASKDGYAWLDLVQADLEGTGYTVGAVVAPAAGFGAPHQRHRMYWVADTLQPGRTERGTGAGIGQAAGSGFPGGLADTPGKRERTDEPGRNSTVGQFMAGTEPRRYRGDDGTTRGLADTADFGQHGRRSSQTSNGRTPRVELERLRDAGFWSAADWIYCRDEKYRPVEPGTFPLAHGAAARVGRLRAYGNAICAPQAEEFIKAYLEVRP
jgi:DNA (cytosine-5)-methyltransferase 1